MSSQDRSLLLPLGISLIPAFLICLNLLDIYEVVSGKGSHPFGSAFFSSASIYASKTRYLVYQTVFTLLLALLIVLAFRWKWKVFWVVLIMGVGMLLYPILTIES